MARPTPEKLAAWRSFLTAHAEVVDVLAGELLEERDIPLHWYEVLLYLGESEHGRLRMHELAESLLLSRSATTRFIDRIERAGLVRRTPCSEDGRGLFVELTDKGRRVFREAAPVHLRGIDEHFTSLLSEREAQLMTEAFTRIVEKLRHR